MKVFLSVLSGTVDTSLSQSYIIGAIIGLLILGYLFYTLIKPEKF